MKTPLAVPLIVLLAVLARAQTPTLPSGYEYVVFHQEASGHQLTGLAFDGSGACYVSDVTGVIKRLEDTNGDLVADQVLQVWPGLGFSPAVVGICFLNGSLSREKVKDAMVKIFYAIGVRSELADDYRTRLSRTLY